VDAPTTEPRLASDQHDVVLSLALGLLGMARRFEGAVSQGPAETVALEADDPVVLASLGAIAFTRSLRRWLEEAAEVSLVSAPPLSTSTVPLPDLLR
jgi:hypothetical protein